MRPSKRTAKNKKVNIWHVLLMLSLISLVALSGYRIRQQGVADAEKMRISQVDTVISYIQRAAKLELELEVSDNHELLAELDTIMTEITTSDSESLYHSEDADISVLIQELQEGYYTFINAIYTFRADADRDKLFNASEQNYTVFTEINKKLAVQLDTLSLDIGKIDVAVTWNTCIFVAILGIILWNIMVELKYNKMLSQTAYIDVSTGLYNRAKCQEVLHAPIDPNNPKNRAIIIFDLNDLKKTNDQLGHRAGDDLIASFAMQLKTALNICIETIFLGRYGGDEFMAYFAATSEEELQAYLEEVQFCIDKFNHTGGREFQLSCAAGYCITTPATADMSMRDLFDQADVNMYENKIAMKKRKKEELLKQGIIVEDTLDDRLA